MDHSDDIARLRQYDERVGDIYARKMPTGTREVALAMAWIKFRSRETLTDRQFWEKVAELVGTCATGSRLDGLLGEDAPRYEPPQDTWKRRPCEGPRMRPYKGGKPADPNTRVYLPYPGYSPTLRDNSKCGTRGSICVIEYDPVTGWQRGHWFCGRHRARAEEVRAQLETAGDPPEPIPNRGGVLPCFFDADWEAIYARYRPGWRPPYHGICGDSWPDPATRRIPRRPRLSLIS